MAINVNLFTRLNSEGGCSQANKVAFQTSNFTPRTAKEIVDNMKRLEALVEAGTIQYGVPFYLPVIITKANEVSAADAEITGIMGADGKLVPVQTAEADEDEGAL